MLDGRLIRVQLRDWNPTYRPSWRPGPNKELDSQPSGVNDDLSVNPKLPRAGFVNIAPRMADLHFADSPAQPAPPSTGEACDLNEVQDETSDQSAEVSSPDGPVCDSKKETGRSPALRDMTLLSSQTSVVQEPALPGTYPAPTIQYWIPNYTPQFPYQMPFPCQPYPSYPFPPPLALPPSQSGGSENGAPSNASAPIGPVSGAYPVCYFQGFFSHTNCCVDIYALSSPAQPWCGFGSGHCWPPGSRQQPYFTSLTGSPSPNRVHPRRSGDACPCLSPRCTEPIHGWQSRTRSSTYQSRVC